MKPYYQDDWVTIFHGDCREILPELPKVDLVLADPPYEKEAHACNRRTRAVIEGRKETDKIGFPQIDEGLRSIFSDLNCNWCLVFCQAEAVKIYQDLFSSRYKRPMVWIKPDSSPQFSGDRPAMGYESIVCAWMTSGKSKWNSGGKRGVYVHNCTSGRTTDHPTEKPISLISELILDFSLGGAILDPFMGSGTTLRAAKDLNRKAIGIEIEERYCEIAAKRMQQEVLDFTGNK